MSSFKFNFCGTNNNDNIQDNSSESILWLECEEVIPTMQLKKIDDIASHANMFTCGDVEIGHVILSEALKECVSENAVFAELAGRNHSDLLPGKYEGGLKIWECTEDLVDYLEQNEDSILFDNINVLDLGCGAGILGIYAFTKGAFVTFQDYNKEVLEHVTIPNAVLNIDEEDDTETEMKKCKFYSGDWRSFNQKLKDDVKYNLILTSETIYNQSNYEKLLELFEKRLKSDGTVFLAAKTHYFGVGGGTRQFESYVEKHGKFKSKVCWKIDSGITREIIKLVWKI